MAAQALGPLCCHPVCQTKCSWAWLGAGQQGQLASRVVCTAWITTRFCAAHSGMARFIFNPPSSPHCYFNAWRLPTPSTGPVQPRLASPLCGGPVHHVLANLLGCRPQHGFPPQLAIPELPAGWLHSPLVHANHPQFLEGWTASPSLLPPAYHRDLNSISWKEEPARTKALGWDWVAAWHVEG